MMRYLPTILLLAGPLTIALPLGAADRTVRNAAELRAALAEAKAGTTILVAPGEYGSGFDLRGRSGTAVAPIVIRGADPQRPPTFTGGRLAWHFSDCSYLTLKDLVVRGTTGNGLNFDDGGNVDTPPHHLTIEDVTILEIGPRGNLDGLKLSGLVDFAVRRCRFEGWGGSAIDMVGCHRGVIEECRFTGKEGFSQDNAVQTKGGSSDILVQTSVFNRAGGRAVNLGGSTGLQFFRPAVGDSEASRITIAGNRFLGSMAPVSYVSSNGGRFVRNTVLFPERWVLRILQEQTDPRIKPSHSGVFEENLIVFDRKVSATVNIGPNTAPATFIFRKNAWFQTDGTARPQLPTPEQNGVYQVDPRLDRPDTPEAKVTSQDPRLKGLGADGYQPRR